MTFFNYFVMQLNTGVIKANPASAKGVVQIMKKLHDFVPLPNGPTEDPYVLTCIGDQLSCERMVDARFAQGDHELAVNTLKGLEPVPGEFHHRCLLLQVVTSKFNLSTNKYTVSCNLICAVFDTGHNESHDERKFSSAKRNTLPDQEHFWTSFCEEECCRKCPQCL